MAPFSLVMVQSIRSYHRAQRNRLLSSEPCIEAQEVAAIKSTLIIGAQPSAETTARLRSHLNAGPDEVISLQVYKVECDGKTYYCCLSGGKMINGEPHFTLVGQGAMESLANLSMGSNQALIIQEVKLGQTPLDVKIIETFTRYPEDTNICFLGDLTKELDGKITPILNISGVLEI